jgi:fucose permease
VSDHGDNHGSFPHNERLPQQRIRRGRVGAATCFLLTGFLFATWGSRIPAIRAGLELTEGHLAIAFMGLNAGAIVGLQVGGIVVPRMGSRLTLTLSLSISYVVLLAPALAPSLLLLTASLFLLAFANSIVDVSMNAQGLAVEHGYGKPLLSSMHAMHSLGGLIGAGVGALAARLGLDPLVHFGFAGALGAAVSVAAWRLLLPSWVDADRATSGDNETSRNLAEWFRGWTGPIALLGVLAFCVTLAEGSALDWSAIYVSDAVGGGETLGAVGLGVFLGAVTLGRLLGDRLIARFGPVRMFRIGVVTAGAGFGGALLIDTPIVGLAGLALLGAGISYVLPLTISAGSKVPGEKAATAAARVSTLAYLGSFVGPALIGGLASRFGLPVALGLPALLVAATVLGSKALRYAG